METKPVFHKSFHLQFFSKFWIILLPQSFSELQFALLAQGYNSRKNESSPLVATSAHQCLGLFHFAGPCLELFCFAGLKLPSHAWICNCRPPSSHQQVLLEMSLAVSARGCSQLLQRAAPNRQPGSRAVHPRSM